MAEFLHEVVRKRELISRELPPALEEWHQRYQDYYNRERLSWQEQLLERIFGTLEEGSDNADV